MPSGRPRSWTPARPAGSSRRTTSRRWRTRSSRPSTGMPSGGAAGSGHTRWRARATPGLRWRTAWGTSTTRWWKGGRRPPALIPSPRHDRDPLPDPSFTAGPPCPHPRRRRWRRGGGAATVSTAPGRAARPREARVDRADAAADRGRPAGLPAAAVGGRRRGSVPWPAARAQRAARLRSLPLPRCVSERHAARGPRRAELAGRARGVVPAPGADGGGRPARRRHDPRRRSLHPPLHPRAAGTFGVLLLERRGEVSLLPPAGAGRDPRLRCRARGRSPRGAGPLGPVLDAARVALSGVARARGLAAPPWACIAALASPRRVIQAQRTRIPSPVSQWSGVGYFLRGASGTCPIRTPRFVPGGQIAM